MRVWRNRDEGRQAGPRLRPCLSSRGSCLSEKIPILSGILTKWGRRSFSVKGCFDVLLRGRKVGAQIWTDVHPDT